MGDFMGQDAPQLPGREYLQYAFGAGNDGMFRIASGGKGIGSLFRHNADPWLGDACIAGQFLNNLVEHGGFGRAYLAGIVHSEHYAVRVPVGTDIHDECESKGNHYATASA